MKILLVGLNHRTAPVEIREKLALDSCAAANAYPHLNGPALKESIIVSTCNRVEVVAVAEDANGAVADIKAFLGSLHGLNPADFEGYLYILEDTAAVEHVFKVASSLDSMVIGEPQILGQLKEAFRQAVENRATGAILNKLLHKSFSVAKRVRTETGIASHAVSIGYAAVELARKIFGELAGKEVLLIGAGEMAELTAEHLLAQGASSITVANRTLKRAMDLAQRWDGQAASLEELSELLARVDIVISSTGAPEILVRADRVKSVLKARKHRPLFFVDIAVPRDVDPEVNRLSNVYLYDIDDLQGVVEENRAARSQEAVRAGRILEEEVIAFQNWLETLDTFPTIVDLREKAEKIRRAELRKTLRHMGPLTPEQERALEVMTRAMAQKLIHDPILFIKGAGLHGKKDFNLDLARRVLGLDRQTEGEQDDQEAAGNGLDHD
jgi:glutamyl-tRNA reductase